MSFQKFPSIEQFRDCIRDITDHTRYVGRDENKKPIYDISKPLPKIEFCGTVKLHGTNAAVARKGKQEFWRATVHFVALLGGDKVSAYSIPYLYRPAWLFNKYKMSTIVSAPNTVTYLFENFWIKK